MFPVKKIPDTDDSFITYFTHLRNNSNTVDKSEIIENMLKTDSVSLQRWRILCGFIS